MGGILNTVLLYYQRPVNLHPDDGHRRNRTCICRDNPLPQNKTGKSRDRFPETTRPCINIEKTSFEFLIPVWPEFWAGILDLIILCRNPRIPGNQESSPHRWYPSRNRHRSRIKASLQAVRACREDTLSPHSPGRPRLCRL